MQKQNYRVILTGELKPGFSREAALGAMSQVFQTSVDSLRAVFEGGEHPVNQDMSADQALDLQSRLDGIGVVSRIEKRAAQHIDLTLRTHAPPVQVKAEQGGDLPGRNAAGRMHCPACGHEQLVSNRCSACGIVFAQYNRAQSTSPSADVPPAPTSKPAAAPESAASASVDTHARDNWHDAWGDFDEDAPPDESAYLGIFFGEKAETYLQRCERFIKGPRSRFALSWNWGAVLSPFVWSLYRKMWGWGLLIFIAEIFVPVLLITLGSYRMLDGLYVTLGYLMLVANRLFWPAVANYLYCRHARSSVQQLHMMSPNYATEIDIATAGGTSNSSVLVGAIMAAVMSVFLWSLVDSIHENGQQGVHEQLVQSLDRGESEARPADPSLAEDMLGISGKGKAASQNKWVATRHKLRGVGVAVNRWMAEHAGVTDSAQLNLFKLRETMNLPADAVQDAWGGEIQYIPDTEGYRLISAGPDRLFGTADDIQYRRVLQ